jgi:hypothetical protein
MITARKLKMARALYRAIKTRFPEVKLAFISESPENPRDVWVNIIMPEDDDRIIEIQEFAGEKSTDILLERGYHITISSSSPAEKKWWTNHRKRGQRKN